MCDELNRVAVDYVVITTQQTRPGRPDWAVIRCPVTHDSRAV